MKLLGSTVNKITKDKNCENVPHLEITEVVLGHCDIVNNDYQQDSRVKPFDSLFEISATNHVFYKHSARDITKLKYGSHIKIVNH